MSSEILEFTETSEVIELADQSRDALSLYGVALDSASPADDEVLAYDVSSGKWTPKGVDELAGGFVNVTGDTMTGDLVMNGANVVPSADGANSVGTVAATWAEGHFVDLYAATGDFSGAVSIGADLSLSGDEVILGAGTTTVRADTSDTSDTDALLLTGGGAVSDARGAYLGLYGNEHATQAGDVILAAGSTGSVSILGAVAFDSAVTGTTLSLSGLATLPSVDIGGGAIDGTVIGASVSAAVHATTLEASGATTLNGNVTLGNAALDALIFHPSAWTLTNAVTITGTWTDLGVVSTADVNGGTIDGVVIGGSTAAAITGTTITATASFSGNLTGDVTGNASTATALETARTIWGRSFDGTGDVSGAITGATTGAFSSNVTIGGTLAVTGTITGTLATAAQPNVTSVGTLTSLTVGGIAAAADSLHDIGTSSVRFANGYFDALDAPTITGAVTGNASTATALQTSRTLWGQSFDGTAPVSGAISDATTIATSGDITVGEAIPTTNQQVNVNAFSLAVFQMYDRSGGTNEKYVQLQHGSGVGAAFRIRLLNDALSSGTNAYVLTQTGTTPVLHDFTGAITSSGIISSDRGSEAVRLYGATSGGHQWDIYGTTAGDLRFSDNTSGGKVIVDTAVDVSAAGQAITLGPLSGTAAVYAAFGNLGGNHYVGISGSSGVDIMTGAYTAAYDFSISAAASGTGISMGTQGTSYWRMAPGGAVSQSETLTLGGALELAATERLYFDGAGGNTYLTESSTDVVDWYVGGTNAFRFNGGASVVQTRGGFDFAISATDKLYFDGVGDTYLSETAADVVKAFVGGTDHTALSLNSSAPRLRIGGADNGANGGGSIVVERNSNATTPAAGYLALYDKSNALYYLWADDSGVVRVNTSEPTNANDAAGTVVGSQTSWWETKDFDRQATAADAASMYADVIGVELWHLRFLEDHSRDGSYFPGLVVWEKGEDLPWYAMNGATGQTPALDPAKLWGRMVGAFQHVEVTKADRSELEVLRDRVAELEARIDVLEAAA